MPPAFISALPLSPPTSASTTSQLCSFHGLRPSPQFSSPSFSTVITPTNIATVTMRCRRDLKKEKALRNMEFSRMHRKRPVRFFNRRAAQEAITNEDNEFLSQVYGTIRFRSDNDNKDDKGSKV